MWGRSFGIIGVGRLGLAFGHALVATGYDLVAVTGRSPHSRDRVRERLPGIAIVEPREVALRARALVLAVPDDAIAPVVADLAGQGALTAGQYLIHLSGSHGLRALQAGTDVGAVPFALHPAMTFTGAPDDADRFRDASFGITTLAEHRSEAERLVQGLGGRPVWVPDDRRTLYHAALVFGANNLITLCAAAMEILRAAGVANPGQLAGPVLRASLENAIVQGDAALTGPVRRGDLDTIRGHLDTLADHAPQLRSAYADFARFTANRAITHRLNDESVLAAVLSTLTDPDP